MPTTWVILPFGNKSGGFSQNLLLRPFPLNRPYPLSSVPAPPSRCPGPNVGVPGGGGYGFRGHLPREVSRPRGSVSVGSDPSLGPDVGSGGEVATRRGGGIEKETDAQGAEPVGV